MRKNEKSKTKKPPPRSDAREITLLKEMRRAGGGFIQLLFESGGYDLGGGLHCDAYVLRVWENKMVREVCLTKYEMIETTLELLSHFAPENKTAIQRLASELVQ